LELKIFDIAVIGGGPAGLQAALVAASIAKKIILIESGNL
jgi:flavin-dependent dehydrogenase